MATLVTVNYENVRQESGFWCWAAVAANVYNSFLPLAEPFSPAGRKLHQCDVAQKVNQSCQSPGPFSLVVALESWTPLGQSPRGLGIFEAAYHATDTSLFQRISGELTATATRSGEPVCAEVDLGSPGTLTHFVTITGFDPLTHNVWVADPFPGGESVEFTLDDFLHRYHYKNPAGGGAHAGGVVKSVYAVHR